MSNEQYLKHIMDEYGDTLLRMCFLYLKDYHLAEDAVQETFIKAMRFHNKFENRSSEKTWLTRIAINCCKNMMRNHWFQSDNHLEIYEQKVNDSTIENMLERASMSKAIMELNETDRE